MSCFFVIGQKTNSLTFYVTGGIKRNIFKQVLKQVVASNISADYSESLISPKVGNTISFFSTLYALKPLNKKFSVSNTLGLDMQQLDITSGFKKQTSGSIITSYTSTSNTDLLARLKVDFGIHYNIISDVNQKLSFGLNTGEMVALSNRTSSYSFIGATLNLTGKQNAVFISGSLTPYKAKIKNLENYVGDINAGSIFAEYAYRIYEINVGFAFRL